MANSHPDHRRFFRRPAFQLTLLAAFLITAGILSWYFLKESVFWNDWSGRYKNLLSVLVLTEDAKGKPKSTFILFIHPEKRYVHVYRVNREVVLAYGWWGREKFSKKGVASMMGSLEKLLKVPVDHYAVIREDKALDFLDFIGGAASFNSASKAMRTGEVILSGANVIPYLEGIEGQESVREDAAFSLYMNAFLRTLDFYSSFKDRESQMSAFYRFFEKTSFSRRNFLGLLGVLSAKSRQIYISYDRMNTQEAEVGGEKVLLPLDRGHYDGAKLKSILDVFGQEDLSVRVFPLTLQVKNATGLPRLAAKTSGTLRIRKCDVKEYLNTLYHLNHSVVLWRSGSAGQRDYLQKITRVDRVYYAVDHRENFDFTIVLGDDYYAIPFLTKQ